MDEIRKDIETFDHGKKIPSTGRNRLTGQLRSGFFLILLIPIFLLLIEFYLDLNLQYFGIIVALVGYVLYEIYNFRGYDQTRIVEESG